MLNKHSQKLSQWDMTQDDTPLPMDRRASRWAETRQENDLIQSLRARKSKQRLILSDSEFAQCLIMARRSPHWRNRSDVWLKGPIIGGLI